MSLLTLGRLASYAALGDFNGDHKLDLAWGWGRGIGLADGRGDGTFDPPIYLDLGREVLWQGFVVADFDGDGQDDLAACEWRKQDLEIYFSGRGQPGYTTPISRLTVAGCGDYDGDGKPDLLLPYNTFHSVETLHNLGNRQFQPGPSLSR